MASFQSLDATVHKNITSTHSSTQFLLSQINPICAMNFFLGIIYVCNGGWILTAFRALINFRHLTNRNESYTKLKKNIYLDKSQKEINIAMLQINLYVTETCPPHPLCEGNNFKWAELHICTFFIKPTLLAVPEI